ncbi:MAG TPA: GNAT family N-acetyltransferase [Alphaproteobacteria bacterium]|nr:GNAT family N-acetyltransferase [Alphaproteobacteria bacterium]
MSYALETFDFQRHFLLLRDAFNDAMNEHPDFKKIPLNSWKPYWDLQFEKNLETFGLIAIYNNKIKGFAVGQFIKSHVFELYWLGVIQTCQKKGIGTELLKSLKTELKEINCKEITLDVDLENEGALDFFHYIGFF